MSKPDDDKPHAKNEAENEAEQEEELSSEELDEVAGGALPLNTKFSSITLKRGIEAEPGPMPKMPDGLRRP